MNCPPAPRACDPASSKSPQLVLLVLLLWTLILGSMGSRLVNLLLSARGASEAVCLSLFCGLLVVFWLLAAYFIALSVIYLRQRKERRENACRSVSPLPIPAPAVALLYPTCDDFQREAALSCLGQHYPHFHLFLLDDSRLGASQAAVDAFAAEFPAKITLVRRAIRTGFKAGNLNHALHSVGAEFPFFAVMDADERIPPEFLSRTMAEIDATGGAFVQASHVPNPRQREIFAAEMGQTILPFWQLLLATKNRFGCVPCVGHGMLVRTECWREVGGFPEVASEDLAFTALLLGRGRRGVYLADLVCMEDFPTSLRAFRRQQERYTVGVFEVLYRFLPGLLRSRRASWIEKIDFLLSCLPLSVPILCVLFLVVSGVALPLCFGRFSHVVAETALGTLRLPFLQAFDARFQMLWTPAFVLGSGILSLAPAFPMFTLALAGRIRRPFRLLVVSNLLCMAVNIATSGSMLCYLWRRSTHFSPTGARDALPVPSRWPRLSPAILAEITLSLGLAAALLSSLNLGLAVVALCPVLATLAARRDGAAIPLFASVAFGGVLGQVLLGFLFAHAPQGQVPLVFSMHF